MAVPKAIAEVETAWTGMLYQKRKQSKKRRGYRSSWEAIMTLGRQAWVEVLDVC